MSLIEKLQNIDSKRGILFVAIENLTKSKEIKEFYQEYILYVQSHGHSYLSKNNPEETSKRNIVYILGCYDKKTSLRWRRVLPEIEPFYKEFYQPYSRKLRKRMYMPNFLSQKPSKQTFALF